MKAYIVFSGKEVWKEFDFAPNPKKVPQDAFMYCSTTNAWERIGAKQMWSQVHPEDVPGHFKVWLMLL